MERRSFFSGFRRRKKSKTSGAHTLWSGCRADQTSADALIGQRFHGAFTYYLHKHLRRDRTVPRELLLRKVRSSLEHNRFSQFPLLEIDAVGRKTAIFGG